MNRPASPISRWKEIVHPIFWPLFFWNLRAFVVTLRKLRAQHGEMGELAYGVTWWGAIRIERIYPEPEAAWDAALQGCARRVHIATLYVFNPHLSARAPLSQLGEGPGVRGAGLSWLLAGSKEAPFPLSPNPSPAGEGDALGGYLRANLAFGTFPNLPYLNTSKGAALHPALNRRAPMESAGARAALENHSSHIY